MEIEALLGDVVELADLTEVQAPRLRTVYAAVSLLAKETRRRGLAATEQRDERDAASPPSTS